MSSKGFSAYTPVKQSCLEKIASCMAGMWSNQSWAKPIIIDCMAGDGNADAGVESSPVILSRVADVHKFPFFACEIDNVRYASLIHNKFVSGVIYNKDCADALCDIKRLIPDSNGGLAYIDPNGTIPRLQEMSESLSRFKRLDVVINYTATGGKRHPKKQRVRDLMQEFGKPNWYIRCPVGAWQWVMLVGSCTCKIREMDSIGFVKIESDIGSKWLDTVDRCKMEMRNVWSTEPGGRSPRKVSQMELF